MYTATEKVQHDFSLMFTDQWDYTHRTFDQGGLYETFLRDHGLPAIGTYPIHLSDVPAAYSKDYRKYLTEQLAIFLDMSPDECAASYTISDAMQEYAMSCS